MPWSSGCSCRPFSAFVERRLRQRQRRRLTGGHAQPFRRFRQIPDRVTRPLGDSKRCTHVIFVLPQFPSIHPVPGSRTKIRILDLGHRDVSAFHLDRI